MNNTELVYRIARVSKLIRGAKMPLRTTIVRNTPHPSFITKFNERTVELEKCGRGKL